MSTKNIQEQELTPIIPDNVIWYKATTKVSPHNQDLRGSSRFGANIIANVWDAETQVGIILFDCDVTKIGDYAFYEGDMLTSIIIPDRVTKIGQMAFAGCENLESIKLGDDIIEIQSDAFDNCHNLECITLPNGIDIYGLDSKFPPLSPNFNGDPSLVDNRCFMYRGQVIAYMLKGLTEYKIPYGVTKISEGDFCDSPSLKKLVLPRTIIEIGNNAFSELENLEEIEIPNSVISIGDYAFCGCNNLCEIIINGDDVNRCNRIREIITSQVHKSEESF